MSDEDRILMNEMVEERVGLWKRIIELDVKIKLLINKRADAMSKKYEDKNSYFKRT